MTKLYCKYPFTDWAIVGSEASKILKEKYPDSKIIKMKLDAAVKKAGSRQPKRSNHLVLSDCTYHRTGGYLPTRKEDMWW